MQIAEVALLTRNIVNNCPTKSPMEVIKDLIPEVAKRSKLKISLKRTSFIPKDISGQLLRYENTATIIYSAELNICKSRFVICKELTHLLVDEPHAFTKDPIQLVSELINYSPPGILDDVDSEWGAYFGAIELLIPYTLKSKMYEEHASGITDYELAQKFRIPEKIMSYILSEKYREFDESLKDLKT